MKPATAEKPKIQLGLIESGGFAGRQIVIPEDHNQSWALVENGNLFGIPKFSKACLIHEVFIPDQGCDTCVAEKAA